MEVGDYIQSKKIIKSNRGKPDMGDEHFLLEDDSSNMYSIKLVGGWDEELRCSSRIINKDTLDEFKKIH